MTNNASSNPNSLRTAFSKVKKEISELRLELDTLKDTNPEKENNVIRKKRALITGLTGQDGSYLAEFLLSKGYEVYGMHRRTSMEIFDRIQDLRKKITLVDGDVTDMGSIVYILKEFQPEEIYNLAGQSFVPASWTQPISTAQINAIGVLNILEAIKLINPKIKFYQASTSEMFGKVRETPQTEKTPFYPRSPYGVAKVFGYFITKNYRESFGLFACNGILFNHESPKRGKQFVTRKITHSVAKIKLGYQDFFEIGNLDAKRDWGFAGDFVEAMWLILQQDKPEDYVIGTGKNHSVREFVEESFKVAGMPITWEGKGLNEVGKYNGKIVVKVSPKFYRPAEVDFLLSNPAKAKKELGWEPNTKFKELVRMMVESDLEHLKKYGLLESDRSKLDKNGVVEK
jgi:GDPmannose 4,6-dehydratase